MKLKIAAMLAMLSYPHTELNFIETTRKKTSRNNTKNVSPGIYNYLLHEIYVKQAKC